MVNAQDGEVQVHQPDVRDPPLHRNDVDSNYARTFEPRKTLVEHCTDNQPSRSLGRILIPCRFRWDSEMPSCCKPCSVSRFVHIVGHDCDFFSQVALLAHIPRESGNFTFANPRALTVSAPFSESVMAVGTGFAQLFRSVGQVRSITTVVEPVRTTTRCRSPAWPSPRRFSSPFSIVNFGSGSTGPDQTRYHQNQNFHVHSSHSLFPPQIIRRIRESAKLVVSLPPDLQRPARDSYDAALRVVFIMGMCSTLMAYIARLPVSFTMLVGRAASHTTCRSRINLWTSRSPPALNSRNALPPRQTLKIPPILSPHPLRHPSKAMAGTATNGGQYLEQSSRPDLKWSRRLSGYESVDGGVDSESDIIGGFRSKELGEFRGIG